MKEMMHQVLQGGLEAELDDELGYTRYDYHNKETENSCNGFSKKTMHTSIGDIVRIMIILKSLNYL
jgi:putative transposase